MKCTVIRAAAVLLSLASAGLFAGSAQAEMKTQWVDYTQGGTALQGYLAYDDGVAGRRPGILLLHRRDGMSELTLAKRPDVRPARLCGVCRGYFRQNCPA